MSLLRVCCLGLLLVSAGNQAETLYRCIGPQGSVSYQAQACQHPQRQDRVLVYQPDPVAIAKGTASNSLYKPHPSAYAATKNVRAYRTSAKPQLTRAGRCQLAKQQRQLEQERLGLSRTFTQLSQMDAKVRTAC